MVERLAANGELHVEKELVLNDELVPTTWWATDAWLRSKLDVMIIRGDTAIVMDWKTGKRNPDFFQMQIFAAQVLKHYPDVHKVVTILTWLKNMSQDFEYYNRETINKSWTTIMEKIRRIHDSLDHDNWPARPSGLCRFCPARHNCDYAKV
jgi:hypothetical protein